MAELHATKLPSKQLALRARCFHSTGVFTGFTQEESEQSIPERFQKILRMYGDRIAVKTPEPSLTNDELNALAGRGENVFGKSEIRNTRRYAYR